MCLMALKNKTFPAGNQNGCYCLTINSQNYLLIRWTMPVEEGLSLHILCTCTSFFISVLLHKYTPPMIRALRLSTVLTCGCSCRPPGGR